MLNPWKRRKSADHRSAKDRQSRGPITIGFEQLEEREMLSAGVALPIIPTETRPLLSMPRPYVGTFDPESSRAVTVSMTPRPRSDDPEPTPRLWPLGGRFRMMR